MNKSIALALLGLVAVGIAVALFWPKPAPTPGAASVLYAGSTNVSATTRFGNGTSEFPLFDLAQLHITNIPASGRVGLFVLTNATFKEVYFNLEAIELWKGGKWVEQAPDWGSFGWELAPGKSCTQPVPEPAGRLPWRLRLGIQEHPRGLRGVLDKQTIKTANTVLFPEQSKQIFSPAIFDGRVAPQSRGDGSQSIRSETNPPSAAVDSADADRRPSHDDYFSQHIWG